jgi:hypothetical protein
MTKLAVLVALAAFATGCSKKSNYDKACQHLVDLAKQELDAEVEKLDKQGMGKLGKELRDRAEASTSSDLATCAKKAEERGIDADCVSGADSLAEAQACLRK